MKPSPNSTLHYVFDPLCGWCYAAAPLIEAARLVPGLSIALHGGGLMAGVQVRRVTPEWREYVMPHDRRIAQITGQPFGQAYFDGLLRDDGAVMDSEPPTAAVLAAQELTGQGLDMLHSLQFAHYVEGQRVADQAVLQSLAVNIGLDAKGFEQAWVRWMGRATQRHFVESRTWLTRLNGQGFPTLGWADAHGHLERLDVGHWLGRVDAWVAYLHQRMSEDATQLAQADTVNPVCSADGCSI